MGCPKSQLALKHCVWFVVRYPASQSCEGEKHQPGFVTQGPPSTEARWNGGEGELKCFLCSHICALKHGYDNKHVLCFHIVNLKPWRQAEKAHHSCNSLLNCISTDEILNSWSGRRASAHSALFACSLLLMFYSGKLGQHSFFCWSTFTALTTLYMLEHSASAPAPPFFNTCMTLQLSMAWSPSPTLCKNICPSC